MLWAVLDFQVKTSHVYELLSGYWYAQVDVNGGETFNTDNHRWSESFKKRFVKDDSADEVSKMNLK
jgi:hypothetical protein